MPPPPFQNQAPGRNGALSGKTKTEMPVLCLWDERIELKQECGASVGFTLNVKDIVGVVRYIESRVTNTGKAIVLVWLFIPATVCKKLREAVACQIQRRGRFASTVMSKAVNAVLVSAHALLANPSLNRTLHSVPAFGPPFHSGPNTVPLFRAG